MDSTLKTALPKINILGPDDAGYDEERMRCWNKDVIHRPAAIVQPTTTEEVSQAVKVASSKKLDLVIACGRHGHDCMKEGAMVLDLGKMTEVTVDKKSMTVTVGGGARLGDMDKVCQQHGVACVTGTNPDTGVVGLSTHGGAGYLSRQYGLAADNFVAAEVVTASGAIVHATPANEHKDLLWAVAGGGSNFGVITALTMKAHPMDHVYGGLVINVAPTVAMATRVVRTWRDWMPTQPRTVSVMCVLPCGAPVVPMAVVESDQALVPQAAGAKASLSCSPALQQAFGSGCGAFGACVSVKMLGRKQYHTELQPQLEAMQAEGHHYMSSVNVPHLTDTMVDALVAAARVDHPGGGEIILFSLTGAVADAKVESVAYAGAGRGKSTVWIVIIGSWKPDADGANRAKTKAWVQRVKEEMKALGGAESAHPLEGNMDADQGGLVQQVWSSNELRLREIKAKYDPDNFFKCNRNIKPTAAAYPVHS
ncbi:hypothetical protein EMIHUDRAFT_437944 [Emiliania huxleyi CCMP1516]|uniref:FAD-binding PCMH-type domain-containing protein n=2 Tax=Emiliania huxleyi TaxID=2903 RepID=A0A0D3IFC3_EMIH1|nr:hypothetical protein EMIHUDRAFT_437944 [Emiliania huxleyi CCMP1516]EOD09958.1 hypothetical protein EMIHUDRAFT_437944 [Emiliania huxleyi CCMP1516]|eukprot:XP_005762387.1 hypothetical protein EMIHUDRAFT_437944 [Emiliania huxleyi CCMP1516]